MSKVMVAVAGVIVGAILSETTTRPVARAAEVPAVDPAAGEFFEKKIRPVLAEHCYKCHSTQAKKPKGGLLADSRKALLHGGDNGPAIVPGQSEKSRLIRAVSYKDVDLRMPPKGKLPDAVIADLTTWVKMGAPWPGADTPVTAVMSRGDFDLAQRKRSHWAWQPIRASQLPAVKDTTWPRSPIDRFILARLEAKGVTPAAPADRRTLLRRLSFDLIGLPPTPAEIDAFLNDSSPQALEKVVDRLLASPHFGERWARHWMDLVRYAETRGHEFDYTAPNAYQYRDYLIRAFNADVPYNQFVIEHIAGDRLEHPRLHPTEGFNESILGTGFWFLGEEVHSPVDVRQDEADRFDNRIDVFSKTFLGLTVSCARCHDHKFDAISTRDYYALFGFLKSSSYRLVRFDSLEQNRRIAAELVPLRERSRPAVQRAVAEAVRPGVDRLADYLLAAREVLLAGPRADQARLEEIARARELDVPLLQQWAKYLKTAARNAHDPLHAWGKVAMDAGCQDPKRLAEVLQPLMDGWRMRSRDASSALQGVEVIVDYSRSRPEEWLPDAVTFGPRPVRPGDIRWGSDPARPIRQVIDYAAAEFDPTWKGLTLAPGAENDPGVVGSLPRAGRTIRTPTFKITAGKVFYRVKGTGRAYAAVDSHVLIKGPLHGKLVQPIKAGERFQWIGLDLSPYRGNYAHIEFTATDDANLAISAVVQGSTAPGSTDRLNQALLELLAGADAASIQRLAIGYQRLFADGIDRLASDRIIGSTNAVDVAQLANWLIEHPELFPEPPPTKRLIELAGPLLAEQANFIARIKHGSRLAMAMLDGTGANEHVFIRGSPKAPGEVVPRRFLEALAGPDRLAIHHGSGRLELARQMTDPAVNPFLTRVLVNRVSHHLFGRGIVPSVDNFGVLGEPPTHPELLDYLAGRFVQDGWSVKTLIRALVLSSTYRMASAGQPADDQADVPNSLLHRMNRRRLEGEAIRDSMLQIAGRLDRRQFGPSVPVHLTEFMQGRGRPASGPLDGDGRRTVYIAVRRNFLSPMMLAFDTPIPFSTVGKRTVSNVPAQSLILMNDPVVQHLAGLWARRVLAQDGTPKDRIRAMYESAFGRQPTDGEMRDCLAFLGRQAKLTNARPDDMRVWTDLSHVLFNVKEFIFLN